MVLFVFGLAFGAVFFDLALFGLVFFGFGLAFLKICADFTLICHCGLLSWLVIAICHCKRARKREAWQSRCFRHWKRIYQNPRGNLVVFIYHYEPCSQVSK